VTVAPAPYEIGGYVLAGGRSSRMGQDKAMLPLAGKPLIAHAVAKLRRLCIDVRILSDTSVLAEYAPIVPDLHPGCGPLGGIEAALTQSAFDWNLFLPVDMPLIPTAFLHHWISNTLAAARGGAKVSLFTVEGVPQPTMVMIHRDVLPFATSALERGEFKLYPVLKNAGAELAAREGLPAEAVFCELPWTEQSTFSAIANIFGARQSSWLATSAEQQQTKHLWFGNLNTPQEFAEAERYIDALDT
jgi:molybdopterin-guanine dinucleotide biosynthesis protein A